MEFPSHKMHILYTWYVPYIKPMWFMTVRYELPKSLASLSYIITQCVLNICDRAHIRMIVDHSSFSTLTSSLKMGCLRESKGDFCWLLYWSDENLSGFYSGVRNGISDFSIKSYSRKTPIKMDELISLYIFLITSLQIDHV